MKVPAYRELRDATKSTYPTAVHLGYTDTLGYGPDRQLKKVHLYALPQGEGRYSFGMRFGVEPSQYASFCASTLLTAATEDHRSNRGYTERTLLGAAIHQGLFDCKAELLSYIGRGTVAEYLEEE